MELRNDQDRSLTFSTSNPRNARPSRAWTGHPLESKLVAVSRATRPLRTTMTTVVKNGLSLLWLPTLVLICALGSAAQSTGSAVSKGQFAETIARIRTGETSTIRTDNAANLAAFTRSIDPKKVDDATLREIVSLLNTDDDSVRFWVAASLGNLGPRARIAVPTLLNLLRKVDCLEGDLTSAGAIRLALTRIGETPPPEPKCVPKRE